jgi:hypothetical protein
MKLTLETTNDEIFTIQSRFNDQTSGEMIDFCYRLLLAAGYSKHIVDEAILDYADEIGAQEGWCMQPNPTV